MSRNILLFFCFSLVVLFSCKSSTSDENGQETKSESTEASTQKVETKEAATPMLPQELMQNLVDSADYVDFVFYTYEFSMSMDNDSGVKYALATIGPEPAKPSSSCKAIGRVFYQIKGRNAASAELYFSPGCTYLEFVENGKIVYANSISDVGKDFLNNQFGQLIKDYQRVQ